MVEEQPGKKAGLLQGQGINLLSGGMIFTIVVAGVVSLAFPTKNPVSPSVNPSYCSSADRSRLKSQKYGGLEQDIRVLVDACWNFQENELGKLGEPHCGLNIPYDDTVSDAVRGTHYSSAFNPPLIPAREPFLAVIQYPCRSPVLTLDGMIISGPVVNLDGKMFSGSEGVCGNGDFYCVKGVADQIRSTDVRGHDLASRVHEFAGIAERRYNHGIKRK